MDKIYENNHLFNFPCEFSLKVMGKAVEEFKPLVIEIVRRHSKEIGAVTMRTSSQGKYMAVTISITAQNRIQLDALYLELSHHPLVKMVL